MKFRTTISFLVASMLAFATVSSFAGQGQGQGQGQGGANAGQPHQIDRDRAYDRERMSDRDHRQDRDRSDDPQQDRDRVRLQDPAKMKDGDIYGNELMSNTERKQYRQELGNYGTQDSREQYQARHEEKLQKRALQQGKDLVPPGQGRIYGGEFMSVQERNQYREQLRLIESDQEREQFHAQHRDRVNQRAKALDLEVQEAE
jgi:hypothetical protein